MTGDKKGDAEQSAKPKRRQADPEWTSSLKRLYDSVVDEPIPASFQVLLAQLDNDEQDDKS